MLLQKYANAEQALSSFWLYQVRPAAFHEYTKNFSVLVLGNRNKF